VVDDEEKIRRILKMYLEAEGFAVGEAADGHTALAMVREGAWDLVILDLMLPGVDGWVVCKEIRRASALPIIMLTARNHEADRILGLELGADDYVVKPFAFSELLARLRAVLRRTPEPRDEVIRVSDLEIDLTRHRATRAGKLLDLSAKEFALLALLARRAGQVLTRTMIAELVWDASFDFDSNVVDVAIHRLREKVDKPFAFPLIHTLRGVGYVLEPRESPEKHAR